MGLGLNVAQAANALYHPRKPEPSRTPAKAHAVLSPPAPRRSLGGLSPNVSVVVICHTRRIKLTSGIGAQSQKSSQKSLPYANSPLSTPSRTLNYSLPAPSSASSSLNTSSISMTIAQTPSPVGPVKAWRGRHASDRGRKNVVHCLSIIQGAHFLRRPRCARCVGATSVGWRTIRRRIMATKIIRISDWFLYNALKLYSLV